METRLSDLLLAKGWLDDAVFPAIHARVDWREKRPELFKKRVYNLRGLDTLKEQRRRLQRLLRDNPSLRARFSDFICDAYGDAIILAAKETGLDENSFPGECPYTEKDILDPEFHPG